MSLQIFHSLHLKMLAVRRWAKAKENAYKVKEASKEWFSIAGGKKAFCGSVIHLKCYKTGFKIFIYNMFYKKDPDFSDMSWQFFYHFTYICSNDVFKILYQEVNKAVEKW